MRDFLFAFSVWIPLGNPQWGNAWAITSYIILIFLISGVIICLMLLKKQKKDAVERTQFFTSTAHDIRTPLTLIKAPLEELISNRQVTEEGLRQLNMALMNVHAILRLTTNLIHLGHIDIYSSELFISEYELSPYAEEICYSFKGFAATKHIALNYECHCDCLHVWFDRDKMDSILKNLLSNAIKYTPDGGRVDMCIDESKGTWSIEVRDTGIGIPESEQKDMFRFSFRASNALNSKVTGSGVGLMLVHKLVCLHKGKIYVNSVVQQGTTIKIEFPKGNKHFCKAHFIHPHHKATVPPFPEIETLTIPKYTKPIEDNHFQHRILIVEDHDDLRTYLTDTLSQYYKVQECCNGKEALTVIGNFKPELILSDVRMPEMGGDELCSVIKSNIETSHIAVVLLTALNDEKNVLHGLKTGADDYIVKPFNMEILKASLDNVLMNRALLRRRYSHPEFEEEDGPDVPLSELDRKFLTAVNENIEKNIGNPDFNVDMLCASVNMCRTNFFNKLKSLTGRSPSDYIRIVRLQHAARLLQEGKYNVTEVAWMSGFNNVKYFREVFKKYYKVCPSKLGKEQKMEQHG